MDNYNNENNNSNYGASNKPSNTPNYATGNNPSNAPNYGVNNPSNDPYKSAQGGYVWNDCNRPTVSYNANLGTASRAKEKNGIPAWVKVLLIVVAIAAWFGILASSCNRLVDNIVGTQPVIEDYVYSDDYVGVLYLDGTISSGNSGDGYSHSWMLKRIAQMAGDDLNKGILLYINTPGGSAYATAELYKGLLEYKETERPIYVYMGNQATSGGYYAAMAADKIYANEECWTGSIGVVISGIFDFSELMERYGIKAENITSGKNKDMGSEYKPLTDEQREIYQGLVDDTFDRFVAAVVKGRKMDEAKVRALADGRIYTATQAVENGLIDEIGTMDDAFNAMKEDYDLGEIDSHIIQYVEREDFMSIFGFQGFSDINKGDLAIIKEILDEAQNIEIQCIAPKKGE